MVNHIEQRWRSWVPMALVVIVSVLLLALYSSWNREIWYDEYVYFALGGLPGLDDAIAAIRETTTNLNQGVTGAYMLVDFALLKIMGASSFALRLPSLIAALWMVGMGIAFLRCQGFSWWVMSAWPLALTGQVTLMYYAGEARTYMPLAAAVVGSLAYWAASPKIRSRGIWIALGWVSGLLGALFHPYFVLYLPLVILVGWLIQRRAWQSRVKAFLNVPLLITILVVYGSLGLLTWARGTANAVDLDPYTFLVDPLWKSILAQLTQFIYVNQLVVVAAVLLALAAFLAAAIAQGLRSAVRALVGPAVLVFGAYALALLISFVSISQGFWIIPRQWIASIALVTIGVTWGFLSLLRLVRWHAWRRVLGGAFFAMLIAAAIAPVLSQAEQISEWQNREVRGADALEELQGELAQGRFPEDAMWIDAARANIDLGGPVSPEFGQYYLDGDWQNFSLSD